MNFVLRSSVNPAYEFDNLSEKQVHVGSGQCRKPQRRPGFRSRRPVRQHGRTRTVRGDGRVPTLHRFFYAAGQGSVRGPVRLPATGWEPGQSGTWIGNLCWWNL